MKNIIKYYYNLDIINIRQCDNIFYFVIDNSNYIFCPCNINNLKKIEEYLLHNYNFHRLVTTLNNEKVIAYRDDTYALFKINTIFKNINLDNIIDSNILISNNNKEIITKWINMWSFNIDYVEEQIKEINSKYCYLYKLINYYVGLAENAIQLLKSIKNESIALYITHKRVKVTTNLVELYNPALLILDTRVRDIAEYYKDMFFKWDININNIMSKIKPILSNYNNVEKQLFFARMLYPTYFFDAFDQIFFYKKNESILNLIVSKSIEYEQLLKSIYNEIKKTIYMENIDWLII